MPQSPHPLTAEDMLSLKSVSDAQISPEGNWVAFTVADPYKTDTANPRSQIWVTPSNRGDARVFTTGSRSDTHPRWSPDGTWLAFLSDRIENGRPGLFLVPRSGGEAQALTGAQGRILDFQWSNDGKQIAFLREDADTDDERNKASQKDDAIEFEQHPKYSRVWLVDLESRTVRQVTQGNVHVWEFDWSPDGREFVLLVSAGPSEYEWYRPRLARVSISGGAPETILSPQGHKQFAMPRWSPDGSRIAFISCLWSDRGVIAGDLFVSDAGGGAVRNITSGAQRDVSSYEWNSDGRTFLVMGYENGVPAIGLIDVASGAYSRLWSGQAAFMDRFWQHFSLTAAGTTLAAAREDAAHPPDIWIARLMNSALEWKQLTHMNPQASDLQVGAMDQVFWKSSDGAEMEGYLIKPPTFAANQSYPLIVWVHGGPAGNFGPRYYVLDSRFQLLAANGFMVFLPNPRGSLGWGTAFTESNVGDMGGMDWQDIMTGVDYCIAQGFADKDRLGIAGWSYGGFMTAWSITQTDRFKAAMMGAAITDWRSFHGTSNLAVWDQIANDASPYAQGGPYDKSSPMNHIAHVKTPTLILHGEADPYVPVSQGYQVFRALKDLGVETEMIVYPREGHHFDEKNHQLDVMRRIISWFKKHLQ